MSQVAQVIDTKFIVRQLGSGSQYTNPSELIVTANTLEEYLRSFYRDGWTLFSADMVGVIPTLVYSFVLVKYANPVSVSSDTPTKSKVA